MDSLMDRQLGKSAAALLQRTLEAKGMRFLLKADTAQIVGGEARVSAVRFADGSEIPADLVVMTAGMRA